MKSNSLEIVLFSEHNRRSEIGAFCQKVVVEWLTKKVLPLIAKQEGNAKKMILKSMTDSPAIYMS